MKLIQLIGSRSKSDFAVYLAYTISALGKRVLIVDATSSNEYLYSYIRREENEWLYDLQNVEILIDSRSWSNVVDKLHSSNEDFSNFDCIIVDSDDSCTLNQDWPPFDETLYVSDNDRYTILRDVEMLHNFADSKDKAILRRIHFQSAFAIPDGYINLLTNNRVEFIDVVEPIEYDDLEHKLKNYMQHEYAIPFNKLTRQYKNAIKSIVTDWFSIENAEVENSLKKNPLSIFFKKYKPKQHFEPNKIHAASFTNGQQESLESVKKEQERKKELVNSN